VVNLPLTDEEIEAKIADLVDRERELIEASGIETNLRLRESQLHT
jgi:NAD+--asparagine ADP-ribosyltransferase